MMSTASSPITTASPLEATGEKFSLQPFLDTRRRVRGAVNDIALFRELIRASATSPAMLVYLDGRSNKITKDKPVPNENYARELMELHTLGVHGGYTQEDVRAAARCLRRWRSTST